jgi:YD repeat-containing protein
VRRGISFLILFASLLAAAGNVTRFGYDPNCGCSGRQAFTYTATGQRATMSDASGLTTYDYDLRDRLTDALGRTTTFLYDELDRRSAWFLTRIRRAVCSIAKSDGQKILPFWADTKQAVS